MKSAGTRGRMLMAAAVAAGVGGGRAPHARGATEALWLGASNGDFWDATRWTTDPHFPRNGDPAGSTYNAVIDATGAPYQITFTTLFSSPFVVDGLTVDSPDVTLRNLYAFGDSVAQREVQLLRGTVRTAGGGIVTPLFNTGPGGTLVLDSGGQFAMRADTFVANVRVEDRARFIVGSNTATLGGTIRLNVGSAGTSTVLALGGSALAGLASGAEILFEGAGAEPNELIFVEPNAPKTTFDGRITFRTNGKGGRIGDLQHALEFRGAVVSETAGRTVTVTGSAVTNRGTLVARDGGALRVTNVVNVGLISASNGGSVALGGNWSNVAGTIRAFAGTVVLGGTFTRATLGDYLNAAGSTVVEGKFRDVGTFVVDPNTTGDLVLGADAEVSNGTITTVNGGRILLTDNAPVRPYLYGLTFDAPLTIRDRQQIAFDGDNTFHKPITLTAGSNFASVEFRNGRVAGELEVAFDGTTGLGAVKIGSAAAVPATFGPGVLIRSGAQGGSISGVDQFTMAANEGVISSRTPGKTITISVGKFTNAGVIEAINGGAVSINVPLDGAGLLRTDAMGTLTLSRGRQRVLEVGGRVFVRPKASGGGTVAVAELALAGAVGAWSGQLDLADNALVVDYDPAAASPLATLADQIKSGRAGGAWNGKGIITSKATAGRTVGYAEAAEVLNLSGAQTATFAGVTVDASSVLVRYTLVGDANLDGAVDFNDLVRLAQNYNSGPGAGWAGGDFTYDGAVDFNDLVKLAQSYNGPALPASADAGLAEDWPAAVAAAAANVPEPWAGLVPGGVVVWWLTGRRKIRGVCLQAAARRC